MYHGSVAAVIIASLILFTGCNGKNENNSTSGFEEETSFFSMDTAVSVKGSRSDVTTATDTIRKLNDLFDRYSGTSDIYALNHRIEKDISDETAGLIRQSSELTEKFGDEVNIFAGDITDCWDINSEDPEVPSDEDIEKALSSTEKAEFSLDDMRFLNDFGSIDAGSVAKGYALDVIDGQLEDDSCCVVSMTSSVMMKGKKPDGQPFTISIVDPNDRNDTLGVIKTDECFLSTSGGYERYFESGGKRYGHIFDLDTGRPAETDLVSVTVLCDSGIVSDFLSTLIYIGGTEDLDRYFGYDDVRGAVAVTDDGFVYVKNVDFSLSDEQRYTVKEWENG